MEEIECSLIRHFENNLRLRSKTGYAEFGYSDMDAPRALDSCRRSEGSWALGTRMPCQQTIGEVDLTFQGRV